MVIYAITYIHYDEIIVIDRRSHSLRHFNPQRGLNLGILGVFPHTRGFPAIKITMIRQVLMNCGLSMKMMHDM